MKSFSTMSPKETLTAAVSSLPSPINPCSTSLIVDEFTGRIMPDRRWNEGLHQAVEAKEGVPIRQNTETAASITYQNFFLLYPKLSGMTGTAKTSEVEFEKIYNLPVEEIPTARPNLRKDLPDFVYKDS